MELNIVEPARASPGAGEDLVRDENPSRPSLKSPRLDAIRSRVSKGLLDPREKYRQQSDPSNPTHENMPLLSQKDRQGIIPVVLANEHRPTLQEVRSGACAVCKKTCGFYCLVFFLGVAASLIDKPDCGTGSAGDASAADVWIAGNVSEECIRHGPYYTPSGDDHLLDKLLLNCNTCQASFDRTCDESDRDTRTGDDTGECDPGTDGFDCAVMEQTKGAVAQAMTGATMPTTTVLLLFVGFGWFIVAPFVLCGAYCCCKKSCASCRFAAVPVISDMVFEIVRSRSLAVVETIGFFLLAAAVFFDAQTCEATFALEPSVSPYTFQVGTRQYKVAEFRDDDFYTRLALMGPLLLRFFMGNLSNNRWQDVGKNLTGVALMFAVFFSLWSLGFLGNDVRYCRYPTAVDRDESDISYCSIISDSLPGGKMAAKSFMKDCDAQKRLMVGGDPASQSNVSFAQLFAPTTRTPVSGIDFPSGQMATADLLPSKKNEFEQWARKAAAQRANETGVRAAVMVPLEPVECEATRADRPCLYKAGSMIEAIQTYTNDCEKNVRMRDSTLLVASLFVLNLLELLLLLKVAFRTIGLKTEYSASTTAFMFPIRAVASIVVSCLLLGGGLASIDYTALSMTRNIESIERRYNEFFVPLMRDDLGQTSAIFTRLGLSEPMAGFHNHYFDSGAELSEHAARPPFNYLDDDCPCALAAVMSTLGKNLFQHVSMAYYYLGSPMIGRRLSVHTGVHHRLLAEAGNCPPNAVSGPDEQCQCIEEFVANVERTGCVPAPPCPGVPNAFRNAEGGCTCDVGYYVIDGNECVQGLPYEPCPGVPHAFLDSEGGCTCDDGYVVDYNECVQGGLTYEMEQIRDIMQRNETGRAIKCSVQYLRQYWEPLPFCIRYAGIISMTIGLVSMSLFAWQFREKALRLRRLVEEYFDPVTGWPKDPDVLGEADVELLTGGKRSWILNYSFLNKLPSFLGLFCGNMVFAFLTHWVVWMIVLYISFCQAIPSSTRGLMHVATPVALEAMLKSLMWQKVISARQGILHPRIYAMIDVILSLTSTVTGPIKTVLRVVGANICLFIHLFRSDVTLMLDKAFFPLDPHYTSTTGLLTALRVQYEYDKIRRTRPADAQLDHLKIYEADVDDEDYSTTSQRATQATSAAAVVAAGMLNEALVPTS